MGYKRVAVDHDKSEVYRPGKTIAKGLPVELILSTRPVNAAIQGWYTYTGNAATT